MTPEEELLQLRSEIDLLDGKILEHLAARARAAQRIGELKTGQHLYRPEREAQVLRSLTSRNPGPLPTATVAHIFREIMSACLALERPLRIAYLGPAGTYSESAAMQHFGAAPTFLPQASIREVFRAVEAGTVDYGVVPVENSTEGAVGVTLDLLLETPLKICGETCLRIHHQLLSRAESLDKLTRIYSHAQSLAQCSQWLAHHLPALARTPVASNAEAARLAAEDPTACAIAGEASARLYELNTLAANIEDEPNNTTRFLVIGTHDVASSGHDKTSLVCSTPHRPGSVHKLLEPLARFGVNMSKFQSRPAKGAQWEYVFYIDVEGHHSDTAVRRALATLNERSVYVKVLGSYPMPRPNNQP